MSSASAIFQLPRLPRLGTKSLQLFSLSSLAALPLPLPLPHIYLYATCIYRISVGQSGNWPGSRPTRVNYLIRINIENSIFYDVFLLVYCSFVARSHHTAWPQDRARTPCPRTPPDTTLRIDISHFRRRGAEAKTQKRKNEKEKTHSIQILYENPHNRNKIKEFGKCHGCWEMNLSRFLLECDTFFLNSAEF